MLLNLSTQSCAFQEENKNNLLSPDLQVKTDVISYACNLDYARKAILNYLAPYWMNYRICRPSQETISRKTGVPLRTVQRVLYEFRDHDLLTITHQFNAPNIYMPTKKFMARESIRRLKEFYLWAQLFWFRLLLFVFLDPSKLLSDKDLQGFGVLRNSNKNLNIKNCNCTTVYYCISDLHSSSSGKNNRETVVNISKKVFEQVKATKGLEFNDAARCALQEFNEEIVVEAADQYSFSYRNKEVDNPWLVFMGIINRICKDKAYQGDRDTVSALRTQYNISVDAPKILTFIPVMSYNNSGKNTPSNGKVKGSGTRTTDTPDSEGWTYGVMPDGTRVRSRPFQGRKTTKELADLTAKNMLAAAKAQINGDEDLKRKILFDHLDMAMSMTNKNTPNLNENQKTNPDITTQ